jgi:hypothetical protein
LTRGAFAWENTNEVSYRDGEDGAAMRRMPVSRYRFRGLGLGLGLALGLFCAAPGCSKDPEVRAVEITKEVDALFAQQKWEAGEKKAQEILALSGLSGTSRDQAKLKLDQAKSEQQAKPLFVKFMGHKDTDPDVAVAAYRDMPENSYYRQTARADYDKIRPGYISDHLEKATAARDNGRCADWKAQVQLVLDVDPQNQKAMELSKKPCAKKE